MDLKEYYIFKNFINLTNKERLLVFNWRNHVSIRKWMFNQNPILLNEHLDFIQQLNINKEKVYWLVFRNSNPIGTSSIVDFKINCAEWGYYIAPEYHETSIGVEFYYFTLSYLFEVIKLEKIYGYELTTNKGASSLNTLFGFTKQKGTKTINSSYIEVNYRELSEALWKDKIKNDPKILKLVNFAMSRPLK